MPSVFLRKMLSVFLISLDVYTRDSSRVCHSGYKVTHLSSRQRPAHSPATLNRSLSPLLSRQHPSAPGDTDRYSRLLRSLEFSRIQRPADAHQLLSNARGEWSVFTRVHKWSPPRSVLPGTQRLKQDNRKIAENFAK